MVQIQNIINTNKTVLIVFHATWCPHCRHMHPIWDRLAKNEESWLTVKEFDIDASSNETLVEYYKIRSVPTMIIFKDSESVWRQSGELSEEELLGILQKYR